MLMLIIVSGKRSHSIGLSAWGYGDAYLIREYIIFSPNFNVCNRMFPPFLKNRFHLILFFFAQIFVTEIDKQWQEMAYT